jgi:hypothetical protein
MISNGKQTAALPLGNFIVVKTIFRHAKQTCSDWWERSAVGKHILRNKEECTFIA